MKNSLFPVLFFICFSCCSQPSDFIVLKKNNRTIQSFFTGMWLMAKKKVESWYWWIATNIASIPLYFVKHYVFTSVYYFILLIMAAWGLIEWMKKANETKLKTHRV